MYKKLLKYLSKRPVYNTAVSMLAGMGVGFLVTYSVVGVHPVRWGIAFLVIALLGYWRAMR